MTHAGKMVAAAGLVLCCAGLPVHGDTAADATGAAAADQLVAQVKLENLLSEMRWHVQFADIKSRLIEQIAEQTRIIDSISHSGSQGKGVAELTAQEKAFNADASTRQAALVVELRSLTQDMDKTASSIESQKPEFARLLRAAVKVCVDVHIGQHQEAAAGMISVNKPGQAQAEGKSALAGLVSMRDLLEQAEKYEREEIQRQIASLLKDVTLLRNAQVVAQDDTKAAGEKAEALRTLADRESRLNSNLVSLRERAANLPEGRKVAEDLHEAQDEMQDATGSLFQAKGNVALRRYGAAIASLDNAIRKLQDMVMDPPTEPSELAQLRSRFEAARAGEIALRDAVIPMEQHRRALGELPLVDRTVLDRLVSSQGKLADTMHAMAQTDLKDFVEYAFITENVSQLMIDSKSRMSHQETGLALTAVQNDTILKLTTIIDALKEEEQQPSTFVTSIPPPGGPGNPGPGAKPPVILPLAELKMLRALELLNIRETVTLNQLLQKAASDEERTALRAQVEKVGQDQKKVGEMAQQLMGKFSP